MRNGTLFSQVSNKLRASLPAESLSYLIEGATPSFVWGAESVNEFTGAEATAIQAQLPQPSPGWSYRSFRTSASPTTTSANFIRMFITTP